MTGSFNLWLFGSKLTSPNRAFKLLWDNLAISMPATRLASVKRVRLRFEYELVRRDDGKYLARLAEQMAIGVENYRGEQETRLAGRGRR